MLIAVIKFVNQYFGLTYITYPNFGIAMPAGYSVIGVDVSHHQQKINWEQLSAMEDMGMKISFVFMKATEGSNLKDNQFKRNWLEAKKYDIPRGAYLYFNSRMDGKSQAAFFIQNVKLENGDFPPVIDIEELKGVSSTACQKKVHECAKTLEEYYHVKPIIYSSADFYTAHLKDSFENYKLWVAHYTQRGKPRIQRHWHLWQHSESGHVNGVQGYVDFNVFNGNIEELNQMRINN